MNLKPKTCKANGRFTNVRYRIKRARCSRCEWLIGCDGEDSLLYPGKTYCNRCHWELANKRIEIDRTNIIRTMENPFGVAL